MATTNKGLNQPVLNSTNWNTPLNDNFGYIDAALGGTTIKNVTGVGTTPVTLTLTEYQSLVLNFTGTLTANVIYQVPSGVGGQWIIVNNTTGAYTLTFQTAAAGANVVVPTGGRRTVFSDGTNCYTADTSASFSVSTGQVVYGKAGSLAGSNNLFFDDQTTYGNLGINIAPTMNMQLAVKGSGLFLNSTDPAAETCAPQLLHPVASGFSTSPSFSFWYQSSTGISNPASGNIGLVSSGNERVRIGTSFVLNSGTGVTATAASDGSKSGSVTYTPTPVGGNFKTITNAGAFTLAAPTATGDYTMIIQITNSSTAGAITMSGFEYVGGDSFTTTNGNNFFVFITKLNGFQSAVVQALQ